MWRGIDILASEDFLFRRVDVDESKTLTVSKMHRELTVGKENCDPHSFVVHGFSSLCENIGLIPSCSVVEDIPDDLRCLRSNALMFPILDVRDPGNERAIRRCAVTASARRHRPMQGRSAYRP
jgi:hypothetical protein